MQRRAFLLGVAAVAAAVTLAPAAEAASRNKVKDVRVDHRGVTLTLALDASPFPAPGAPYTDPTTLVFVPRHYRLPRSGAIDMVVHFHGHNTNAARAMRAHELREQLFDSKQNAILVVPQGPVLAADSSGGKLDAPGGLQRLLDEVVQASGSGRARAALPDAGLGACRSIGMTCLSAHSGGYKVTASCLRQGGVEVSEVYLFDALYGEVDTFRDWVAATKDLEGRDRHKLVCHYAGGQVREQSLALLAALEAKGVECLHETRPGQLSRSQLTSARAAFLASPLSHVGVTHETNALRDCLFASGLHRRLGSSWFEDKDGPRRIEPRRAPRSRVPSG